MRKWRINIRDRWRTWLKKHWEPEHSVGFRADGMFLNPGRTVYPPLRRAAIWLVERRDSILEKIIVAVGAAIVLAVLGWLASTAFGWLKR